MFIESSVQEKVADSTVLQAEPIIKLLIHSSVSLHKDPQSEYESENGGVSPHHRSNAQSNPDRHPDSCLNSVLARASSEAINPDTSFD